jgi:ABC transport system ATP-binding/permease protein
MAHLLNLEAVTVAHPERRVLDQVSLGLDDGDRIGVVGRNGGGKSTLLRVLAGRQEPDAGRVTHRRDLRVGLLDQADEVDPGSALDVRTAVLGDAPDHVWAGDPLVREVLTGLLGDLEASGVGGAEAPLHALSGGQRRRVALARLLVADHEVLLLDEPTNHLDLEGVNWLAGHLGSRWPAGRGGLAVVTHDRWFLDAVSTRTWEVHDGEVEGYEGGYAAYVLTRAERGRVAAATEARRQNLLRKELAWLRRGPPARTSKPRFRIDAATELIADEPPPRDGVALSRIATSRLGKDVLDLEGVGLRYGADDGRPPLLHGITWRLGPGDRVGMLGANGSGKTTLLRLLTGELQPTSGRVRRGKTVHVGLLSQHLAELAPVEEMRAAEAAESVRRTAVIDGKELTAAQLLERLGFGRERAWTVVRDLSGGERRRLQLLRLLLEGPNVLLLDEPTNDLDTDTLAAMEDVLDGWPGTLVVVSHDRYLLERVCDRFLALPGDGGLRDLPQGVEGYLALGAATRAAPPSAGPSGAGSTGGETSATAAPAGAADVRAARKELTRLERRMAKLAQERDRLHTRMAEQATDHEAVLGLSTQLDALTSELEQVELDWLAAAEVAEA